jgi:glycolate oxidase iron-sulfur subunit
MFLLRCTPFAEKSSRNFKDIFSRCLLCGACERVCSRNLPIRARVIDARSRFLRMWLHDKHGLKKNVARQMLATPVILQTLVRVGISLKRLYKLPKSSGMRLKLALLENYTPPQITVTGREDKNTDKVFPSPSLDYFSGCLARFIQPSVAGAVKRLAAQAGDSLHTPSSQGCCGLAALAGGKIDQARELAWNNICGFAGSEHPILSSCASCSSHLLAYPELFKDDPEKYEPARQFSERVEEFSEFFLKKPKTILTFKSNQSMTVFYHNPCHLRFSAEGGEDAKHLLDRVAGLERVESEGGTHCCGHGGLFHLGSPKLSGKIFNRCQNLSMSGNPQIVTTTCSGCLMQWQEGVLKHNLPVAVRHLALLLEDCL